MPEIVDFNSMQANVGLVYEPQAPPQMRTPSPGEAAIGLTHQATQNLVEAQQQRTAPMSVGQQFRQQFQAIQAQQSLNPYAAQAMASALPGAQGYATGMLPSPITMTPPSTGVFRPPAPPPMMPLLPMQPPPVGIPPFTPQLPAPMFQTPYDQQARLADVTANRQFAYAAQAPNVLGQGLGYLGGAWAGARMGARFGPWGAVAGGIGGAAMMGATGIAEGMGDIGNFLMRPAVQRRQMGAAIQNLSRDFVVGGPQVHALGRGLTRDASIQLAGGIQEMAGQEDFRTQTGGMFNQADLMRMLKGAGQAGLMDMQQSVPQIQQQLRQVAQTVSRFMQLTNDPDVTNVIRQMGQLQQFGLNPQEMEQAAYNMRRFSRAAGTSIEGLQQMGGLPGAMTFQQAGMTAGAGFQYGNYAAAAARQMVASGNLTPRQVALMGGVQGITQRDIQAQAAFSAMPLFTASMAQYGPQGWGVNAGRAGQVGAGGALGMVQGAVQGMNQAVQRGGIGALAMYPLRQRELREQAMAQMTPAEMMSQRFQMAMQTGRQLGLRGEGAFAAGARLAFGEEVAEQMMYQARSPGFWDAQQDLVRRQKRELAMSQRQQIMEAGSGRIMRGVKGAYRDSWLERGVGTVREFGELVASPFGRAGGAISGAAGDVADWWEDLGTPEGIARTRVSESMAAAHAGLRRRGRLGFIERGGGNVGEDFSDVDNLELQRAMALQDQGLTTTMARVGDASVTGLSLAVGGGATTAARVGLGARAARVGKGAALGGIAAGVGEAIPWLQGQAYELTMDPGAKRRAILNLRTTDRQTRALAQRAAETGGKGAEVDKITGILNTLAKKSDANVSGYELIQRGGRSAQKKINDAASRGSGITNDEWRGIIVDTLKSAGIKDAEGEVAKMDPDAIENMKAQMLYQANQDPDTARAWQEVDEQSLKQIEKRMHAQMERRTKHLDDNIEQLESKIDFEFDEGMTGLATELGGEDFVMASVMAAGGDLSEDPNVRKQYNRLKSRFLASGKSRKSWDDKIRKMQENLGPKGKYSQMMAVHGVKRSELAEVMESGIWDAGGTVGTVTQLVRDISRKGLQAGFASKGFRETITPYIGTGAAEELFGGGGMITAETVAQALSPDALKRMERSGASGKRRAAMYRKAQAGDEKALAAIQSEAVALREAGETEDVVAREATGEQADKLRREEKAFGDMKSMFRDFTPAAREFKMGARMLRQAMESDMMKKMR